MENTILKKKNRKVVLKSFGKTLVVILGTTFGIWFSLFFVNIFYSDMLFLENLSFKQFINNGSFLLITFSILTTLLVKSIKNLKVNFFNVTASVGIIIVGIYYGKLIGLNKGVLTTYALSDELKYFRILPFILSLILLFIYYIYDGTKNKSLWLNGAKSNNTSWNIFLSYAIAGSKSKTSRITSQNEVKELQKILSNLGYNPIFNASDYFETEQDYQPPQVAAREDFKAIENCKNFLFYYPERVASSALVELGYAIRDRDNIIIICKNRNILPFLVRELDGINENIKIISEYTDFNNVKEIITSNHSTYFKK
ncbi:hypothetical protein [Kordia jejudonensis]|uniref:hypothetical protein n=1 Tax=Kordia jejudonensis TaxID=1348245 RepID=UPI0006292326|nr:hypothetical protein [Kordia jejudonensis]